ncbi:MAG: restriction endonuclease subunit M [Candidatus Ryanbacteria bacterium CG10_big_fil_rev_8_21_14_0_10_43_42]|uniref:site-specific DNA-methyltransferase (cytosine-N(4)-specific) n=1 Tax=Candidatus Ryanbacteria bacterium CG10_big_fil_rev_8_21_14_0_10_43_42 TaxID=1974864 RepID=A0A2M8KXL3_9BACT|nr:MAG: restriction endonuclease subunit M [Candidatus Ryanbacteria bacterium CG10_big_fil_rev_8_21_14_0_10_43_42]
MSLVTIQDASKWATDYLEKEVSPTNISYLVQYGKVKKHGENGSTLVDLNDLKKYYASWRGQREVDWKKKLGDDLNWALSFDHLREKDTTKHVHRLHPYKGKFIPQLVQYFIDDHMDDFKTDVYFKKGDVVLDPFSGSGTTLVQANEMGIHSVGIDISHFNCMISDVKLHAYDFISLRQEIDRIKKAITSYEYDNSIVAFENELMQEMYKFNTEYFPSPGFRYQLQQGKINENKFAEEKEKEFLTVYNRLVKRYGVELKQTKADNFLDKWYCRNVRKEIDFAFNLIKEIKDVCNKKSLAVILSRTIRSCRATTHSDLATLKEPQLTTYYCWKHKKICKPLYSIKCWFDRYASDTLARLQEFDRLRGEAHFTVLPSDSRTVNIFSEAKKRNKALHKVLEKQKIRGIFTSPPYVGQIDYHEQHAYAYDLFGFDRKDNLEIGPLYKGQGLEARRSYVEGIADVLNNCKKYLQDDYDIFLVANDKYNLYPEIAEKSGMKIVNQFKRPVLNRTERDRNPYSEIIFHFKSQ